MASAVSHPPGSFPSSVAQGTSDTVGELSKCSISMSTSLGGESEGSALEKATPGSALLGLVLLSPLVRRARNRTPCSISSAVSFGTASFHDALASLLAAFLADGIDAFTRLERIGLHHLRRYNNRLRSKAGHVDGISALSSLHHWVWENLVWWRTSGCTT